MKSRLSWPAVLAGLLGAVFMIAMLAATVERWLSPSGSDLEDRFFEYASFREGVYPNAFIEPEYGELEERWSVYPPYAFPMLAPIFEPGGFLQGRLLIQLFSYASLFVMGRYGFRTLSPYGRPLAILGAVLPLAVAGNITVIRTEQFSILCVGLIVMQMELLDRGKPAAAAACWTLAMIKPQIALPFAALFFLRRGLPAFCGGVATLVALSALACRWTEVPISAFARFWLRAVSLRFLEEGSPLGPGGLASIAGIDLRLALALAAAAALLVVALVLFAVRRWNADQLLPTAAACAVAGMFMCYHRRYDNVMLFPAVLLAVESAARSGRWIDRAIALALMATLAAPVPMSLVRALPMIQVVEGAIWLCAGIIPVVATIASRRRDQSLG